MSRIFEPSFGSGGASILLELVDHVGRPVGIRGIQQGGLRLLLVDEGQPGQVDGLRPRPGAHLALLAGLAVVEPERVDAALAPPAQALGFLPLEPLDAVIEGGWLGGRRRRRGGGVAGDERGAHVVHILAALGLVLLDPGQLVGLVRGGHLLDRGRGGHRLGPAREIAAGGQAHGQQQREARDQPPHLRPPSADACETRSPPR
ncbi:MAG: hypothetical protein R3F60_21175 [bacterium]